MQGWDSVELEADIEIGGNEQLFNLMVGRELQKQRGQRPQICLTLPIIEGLDGAQKMSKSLGNYIGVTESPTQMFGKCMSIPDELVGKYFTHLTDVPEDEIQAILGSHPREAKVSLARHIVTAYHDAAAGESAAAEFDRVFKQGGLPDEIPEVAVPAERLRDGLILVANALQVAGICQSGSEGRRLVKGGGVKVDGEPVTDVGATLAPGSYLLQSGKRKAARVMVP